MDRPHIVDIAVKGTELVKKYAADFPGKIVSEYSRKLYGTEMDFALNLYRSSENLGDNERKPNHYQFAVYCRDEYAERLCGSDRVDEPSF